MLRKERGGEGAPCDPPVLRRPDGHVREKLHGITPFLIRVEREKKGGIPV